MRRLVGRQTDRPGLDHEPLPREYLLAACDPVHKVLAASPVHSYMTESSQIKQRTVRTSLACEQLSDRSDPGSRAKPGVGRTTRYDAFISYSHKDDKLGRAIQSGLRRFARPWYRKTAIRTFRDETDLAANPSLWGEIEHALSNSSYFLLLASPNAATSKWVARELEYWLTHKGCSTLLIGLTDGTIHWDPKTGDFDQRDTSAVPPSLMGAFPDEPLYADFSWATVPKQLSLRNRRFATEVARLVSRIIERPLAELIGEEVRQRRRSKVVATLLATVIATALTIAGWQWQVAGARQQIALAAHLANQSRTEVESNPDLALLLGVEAIKVKDTPASRESLLRALEQQPLVLYLRGNGSPITSVVITPDGRLAVSGDESGRILAWDVESGEELGPAILQQGAVTALAISPDGTTLASGSGPNGITLWDIHTRKQKADPLKGQSGLLNGLVFSADGKMLASGSSDGTLRLWDPENAKPIGPPLNAGIKAILAVAFSSNGGLVAAGGEGGVNLFDMSTKLWQERSGIDRKSPVLALSFAPHSPVLAAANADGAIVLSDTATGEARFLSPHTNVPQAVVFSSDGTQLICGDDDGALRRWNVQTGTRISPDWRGSNQPLSALAVSPANGTLLAGYRSGTVVIWDPAKRNTLATELSGSHTAGVSSLAFTRPEARLISGGYDNRIVLWDTGSKISEIVKVNNSTVQSVAVSPDGSKFAFRGGDHIVSIGNLAKPRSIGAPIDRPPAFSNLSFAEGGKTLVYGTVDGVAFRSLADGSTVDIRRLPKGSPITSIAYDSAGDRLAVSGRDGEIILLKSRAVEEGRRLFQGSNVTSLTFSPDGQILASAGDNGEIVAWRISNRSQLWRISSAHSGEVLQLAFSPHGDVLASGGSDDIIGLWDVATGQAAGALAPGNAVGIEALEFNPDGTLLASGGGDNSIRLWETNLDEWKRHACGIVRRDLSENEWRRYVGYGHPVPCSE